MKHKCMTHFWSNSYGFESQFQSFFVHLALCDIQNPGLVEPSKCESCKFFTIELQSRLQETGKKKDVLRTGHGLDPKKKKAVKV